MHKIFLVFFLAGITSCMAVQYDDIIIEADNNPSYRTMHGYFTYKIKVSNVSATQSHQVELKMPERSYGYQAYIQELTKTVVVPPRSSIDVMMLQPGVQMQGSGLGVIIDGRKADPMNFVPTVHTQDYYDIQPRTLVSQSVKYDDILDKANTSLSTSGTKMGGMPKTHGMHALSASGIPANADEMFIRSNVPVSQWNRSWINYSCFDSLIVSDEDMRVMPQDVQDAIYEYVSVGGSLLIVGEYSDANLKKFGASDLVFENATAYNMGFGNVVVQPNEQVSLWSNSSWEEAANACWEGSVSPFKSLDDYESVNSKFPIADIGVPVRGLFTLVLVFAIAIGPVNMIVLSRKKKRIWLLWTVPAMSFITCVVIFAYSVFAEGWTAYSRTLSVTVLDQRSHKAATLGWQAFYSPLSPGDGLHYDLNTEITMLGIKQHSSETRPCRIDLTSDQHLSSGFLKSRVPAHLMVRKCQLIRQRVIVETDEKGNLTASNGLGAAINKFYYVRKQGDKKLVYYAQDIGEGAKVKLSEPNEISASGSGNSFRKFYRGSWPMSVEDFNSSQDFIETEGYVAYCDKPMFIEEGFKNAKPKQSQSVIIGIME